MEELLKPVKALSDETRLRILNIVVQRECCVCEVMQVLGISQTRASRNLKILEEARFLQSRRTGVWVYYSLSADSGNGFAAALAKTIGEFAERYPVFRKDKEKLSKDVKMTDVCKELPACGLKKSRNTDMNTGR